MTSHFRNGGSFLFSQPYSHLLHPSPFAMLPHSKLHHKVKYRSCEAETRGTVSGSERWPGGPAWDKIPEVIVVAMRDSVVIFNNAIVGTSIALRCDTWMNSVACRVGSAWHRWTHRSNEPSRHDILEIRPSHNQTPTHLCKQVDGYVSLIKLGIYSGEKFQGLRTGKCVLEAFGILSTC